MSQPRADGGGIDFHPLADLFPMMSDGEIDDLADDIEANGLHRPIVLNDGLILDGRNRYIACLRAGMTEEDMDFVFYGESEFYEFPVPGYAPPSFQVHFVKKTKDGFIEFDGPHLGPMDDPIAFVVSLNLKRRHLDESQRALIAAKIATMQQGEHQTGQLAGLPTQAEAAEMMNVGERSVRRAREVIEHGTPNVVEAVEKGEVSVSAAARAVRSAPKEEQKDWTAEDIKQAAKPKDAAPKPEPKGQPKDTATRVPHGREGEPAPTPQPEEASAAPKGACYGVGIKAEAISAGTEIEVVSVGAVREPALFEFGPTKVEPEPIDPDHPALSYATDFRTLAMRAMKKLSFDDWPVLFRLFREEMDDLVQKSGRLRQELEEAAAESQEVRLCS